VPGLGDEGAADFASSVRIGIACRFGLVVESRPVEATAWLKVVCSRPSSGEISSGSGSRYVFSSFEYSRHSSIAATISCSPRIERRTRESVE
jgi:hypothetical protein